MSGLCRCLQVSTLTGCSVMVCFSNLIISRVRENFTRFIHASHILLTSLVVSYKLLSPSDRVGSWAGKRVWVVSRNSDPSTHNNRIMY